MTHEEWRQQLDKNREDWDLKRVYADWLEEVKGDQDFARFQRWLADNKRRPYGTLFSWCNDDRDEGFGDLYILSHVPQSLRADCYPVSEPTDVTGFVTGLQAEQRLFRNWLGSVYDTEGRKAFNEVR